MALHFRFFNDIPDRLKPYIRHLWYSHGRLANGDSKRHVPPAGGAKES